MADLTFENVRKVFAQGVVAVEGFSLIVRGPRMVVLVGPSGCGKTTLLRMIAGLEHPTSGRILLGDERLDTMQPRHRDIAMVFQSYALYPHMTVARNLSFGLRVRRVAAGEIERRVSEAARTLELESLLGRKPAELSGGQRQRVALGRAIVREPRVFLFDEPLSNLDARLRTEMRGTIRRLFERLKTTSVYVTHDQVEAMTIGDLLVVMNQGRIHQVGGPEACYRRPRDTFVASFLGSPAMNFADGRADGNAVVLAGGARFGVSGEVARALASQPAAALRVGIRPEDIHADARGLNTALALRPRLLRREPLGHETLTHLELDGIELVARGAREFAPGADGRTEAFVDAGRVHIFWSESGRRVDADGDDAAVAAA